MDRGLCNAIVHEVADAMSCDDGVVLYDAVGDNYGCGRSCCVVAMNGGGGRSPCYPCYSGYKLLGLHFDAVVRS